MGGDSAPRRPNVAHGTVDRLAEWVQLEIMDRRVAHEGVPEICQWLNGNPDVLAELAKQGKDAVSESALYRWLSRKRDMEERIRVSREQAAILAKYLLPGDSSVEEGAVGLASALILEALSSAQNLQVRTPQDLATLIRALATVQGSQVGREKWTFEKENKLRLGLERARGEIRHEVGQDVELMRRMMAIVDGIEQAIEETEGTA